MSDIPYVTAGQMREVDRVATEKYGIKLVQMMEIAGRQLARLARCRFLAGDPRGKTVVVLAGGGGNGGGGLVCARTLNSWGATAHVMVDRDPRRFQGVLGEQLARVRELRIPVVPPAPEAPRRSGPDVKTPSGAPPEPSDPPRALQSARLPVAHLVIDALIGYGLKDLPRRTTAALIQAANAHSTPVLSLDIPSGLDATTGETRTPSVKATATLTLALPKTGLRAPGAREWAGEVYLGDIGIPAEVYREPGLDLQVGPLFAREEILRL